MIMMDRDNFRGWTLSCISSDVFTELGGILALIDNNERGERLWAGWSRILLEQRSRIS
jgi:hypothetical protein